MFQKVTDPADFIVKTSMCSIVNGKKKISHLLPVFKGKFDHVLLLDLCVSCLLGDECTSLQNHLILALIFLAAPVSVNNFQ